MKILGADGLVDGTNALNKIPEDYLVHGDCACAKYDDKFYWYVLEDHYGGPQSIPHIIRPEVANSGKRWILKDIFLTAIEVENAYINNIYPLSGSDTINFNNTMTLSAGLSGGTVVFENTNQPFVVYEGATMIENLNAEYWGGMHWTEFDLSNLIWSGDAWIPQGTETIFVVFPAPRFNTTYSLFTELSNVIASQANLFNHMVIQKTTNGFTVQLSSKTDNPYYRLQWAILGENVDAESFNLLDVAGNPIQDVLGNQITVL
jgi:hypothetical protein